MKLTEEQKSFAFQLEHSASHLRTAEDVKTIATELKECGHLLSRLTESLQKEIVDAALSAVRLAIHNSNSTISVEGPTMKDHLIVGPDGKTGVAIYPIIFVPLSSLKRR